PQRALAQRGDNPMMRITNADQVLMLLRVHLQRTEKTRRGKTAPSRKPASKSALQRVQALASEEALSPEDLERALIAGIFTEEFGSAAANDPKFQTMVDDVLAMIRKDQAAAALLKNAVGRLAE